MQTTKLAAIVACCAALALTACSKASSAIATATGSAGSLSTAVAVTSACSLLTKDEVAKATGNSVDFTKQASHGSVKVCTFASLSGSAIALSVGSTPAAGLSGDIPGIGNAASQYHMTQVSGIGDQAYAGSDALIASKGSTLIFIVDIDVSNSSANHQQALETMAKDVFSKV